MRGERVDLARKARALLLIHGDLALVLVDLGFDLRELRFERCLSLRGRLGGAGGGLCECRRCERADARCDHQNSRKGGGEKRFIPLDDACHSLYDTRYFPKR